MTMCRVLLLVLALVGCLEAAGSRLSCPSGWISDNGKFPGCVACPPGTYQHKPSRKMCRPCPANTTTRSTATISRSECVPPVARSSNSSEPCAVGSYSTTGYQPCVECPIGHYSVNRTTCLSCPSRKTTTLAGATDIKNCTKFRLLEPCPVGFVSASGYKPNCVKCAVGTHQPFEGQRVCAICPEGFNTTSGGAVNCTLNTTMEDITAEPHTTFTHIKVDKPEKRPQGVKTVRLVKISGEFSSKNYPDQYPAGTIQHWKIHCRPDERVGIILLNMSLSDGDFLQLRDEQWNGTLDIPRSTVFRKQTIGILFSGKAGNSTGFDIAFLCISDQKWSLAESILYNRGIMEIVKEGKVAVKKTIELILNPLALIYGFSDPYQRRILQLHFGRF